MNEYYYKKYMVVYTKIYNLSVEHDNLMGKCVDWNFMNNTVQEYIDKKIESGEMTREESVNFKHGWNYYIDRAFD